MRPSACAGGQKVATAAKPLFTWNPDPYLIRDPIAIRYYGILFALTLLGGLLLLWWQLRRGGRSIETAYTSLVYLTVAIVVGARLGHVLFYDFERATADPLYVFKVWRGGLSSHGTAVAIIIALFLIARKHKMPLGEMGDRFSFSTAWGATLIRVGNFLNSEIVGRKTDATWGVRFPRYDHGLPLEQVPLRHPSQLYEVGLGVFVFLLLFVVDRVHGEKRRRQGLLFGIFLAVYFFGRFFVEFFKAYQTLSPRKSSLTMGQYLSIPLFLFGVFWIVRALRRPATSDDPAG